ncbi:MAG: VWA domain-containing protein [Pseudomonadota bacterium]|nr:VWA domain-containing protein [Pseudomonadota bacterium]
MLLHDRAGSTLAMIAAALVPLLAMVGGGIDMGRSYLSQSRLQQACDSGVLAARKKLGSSVVSTGVVPGDVAAIGNRFFNLNYRDGAYGTVRRSFAMTLEPDFAISGNATVAVPTTIMKVFGFSEIPIQVKCEARLNFSNTDVMFVLDTTGSMADTNPGDSAPKIDVLRQVVKAFHAQLEGSKTAGTRIRYGFVPYSSNVNVGGLLKPDWMVNSWHYQGRVQHDTGTTEMGPVFTENWTYVSGTEATGSSTLTSSCPGDTRTWTTVRYWVDPDGTENTEYIVNGSHSNCTYADNGNVVSTPVIDTDYRYIYSYKNEGNKVIPVYDWHYQSVTVDVSSLKDTPADTMKVWNTINFPDMAGDPRRPSDMTTWFSGCVEERSTYEINDYNDVDFARAMDLDLDRVPDPANPDTQWRPMLHDASFVRGLNGRGSGTFSRGPIDYKWDYLNAQWAGLSACPSPARKLGEMSAAQISTYVDNLQARGSTYHDIGMIWGGRLLSPTGIFAGENADIDGKSTRRNLIFLTDGQTAPLDVTYGTYGIEPIEQPYRRWSPGSPLTLTKVVENRFTVACNEVKKRNITVWVVSFGTSLNPMLSECAGPGHAFEASNASELSDAFNKIATQVGDLRISK